MSQSEQISDLAKALADAQAEIENAEKSGTGNYGKYATLGSVREAVTPSFSKNGLSVCQTFGSDEQGDYLETHLLHLSGQWISGRLYLKLEKPTMQGLGSAITYARRYALAAIANIAQEDDDGTASEGFNRARRDHYPTPNAGAKNTAPLTGNDFQFSFGPFKGKTFSEIDPIELKIYVKDVLSIDSRYKFIAGLYDAWMKSPSSRI